MKSIKNVSVALALSVGSLLASGCASPPHVSKEAECRKPAGQAELTLAACDPSRLDERTLDRLMPRGERTIRQL